MLNLRRVLTFLAVVGALAGFAYAGTLRGGDEPAAVQRTSAVQRVEPTDGSPVAVRQAPILVDLEFGYRADLRINGVDIPEDELDRNEPENQLSFRPGAGKTIEELAPGPVSATALIWNELAGETRDDARPFTWSFNVA